MVWMVWMFYKNNGYFPPDPGVMDPGVMDPGVVDPGVVDPEVMDPGVMDFFFTDLPFHTLQSQSRVKLQD